jgi:hypothetical protein
MMIYNIDLAATQRLFVQAPPAKTEKPSFFLKAAILSSEENKIREQKAKFF